MTTRLVTIALVAAVLVFFACDQPTPLDPATSPGAHLAKGGVKGPPDKGGGGEASYDLLEYWVMPQADGSNLIHVVGSGDVDAVDGRVMQDYFFNGARDDDLSLHYEYFHIPPTEVSVEPEADGTFHVDIPWAGERGEDTDYWGTSGVFPDLAIADLDGTGTDPFVFGIRFEKNGSGVWGFQPQGVILGGETMGAEATLSEAEAHHGLTTLQSYAENQGAPPAGRIYLEQVTINSVSCTIESEQVGKGRNKTTEYSTHVSADVAVMPGSANGTPSAWLEFHLTDGAELSDGTAHSVGSPDDGFSNYGFLGTVSAVFEGARSAVDVQLVVDYVYPTRDFHDHVYDPGLNTDAGFTTSWPGPAAVPGDPWPEARSGTVSATCSEGSSGPGPH